MFKKITIIMFLIASLFFTALAGAFAMGGPSEAKVGKNNMQLTPSYASKAEFIRHHGDTCEVATDGVNTFWDIGGKFDASTLVAYPENFTPEWKCVTLKNDAKEMPHRDQRINLHMCKAWTDGCNTYTKMEDGSIASTQAYCPVEDLEVPQCLDFHTPKEIFENDHADTCEIATDGVNTFWNRDGKFDTSTLIGYPEDFTPKWECVKEKGKKGEKDAKALFEEKYGDTCAVATDGANTFWNRNGKFNTSTLVGYPEDFTPEWKCIKEKEEKDNNKTNTDTSPKFCTKEYAPVCGVDGKTYGNSCTAGDTEILFEGTCDLSVEDKAHFHQFKKKFSSSIVIKLDRAIDTFAKKIHSLDKAKQKKTIGNIMNKIYEIQSRYYMKSFMSPKDSIRLEVVSYIEFGLKKKLLQK